jgi:hypothetical protein
LSAQPATELSELESVKNRLAEEYARRMQEQLELKKQRQLIDAEIKRQQEIQAEEPVWLEMGEKPKKHMVSAQDLENITDVPLPGEQKKVVGKRSLQGEATGIEGEEEIDLSSMSKRQRKQFLKKAEQKKRQVASVKPVSRGLRVVETLAPSSSMRVVQVPEGRKGKKRGRKKRSHEVSDPVDVSLRKAQSHERKKKKRKQHQEGYLDQEGDYEMWI